MLGFCQAHRGPLLWYSVLCTVEFLSLLFISFLYLGFYVLGDDAWIS